MKGIFKRNGIKYCISVHRKPATTRDFVAELVKYDDVKDDYVVVEEEVFTLDAPDLAAAFLKAQKIFKII